jgi:hypothetical protein
MAEVKTRKTNVRVEDFLNTLIDERKKQDSFEIVAMMKEVTQEEPAMWGDSIIGFGSKPLKYENGRELDWPIIAFSPRKQNICLYLYSCEEDMNIPASLGKFKTGKVCLYINRLADINRDELKRLIKEAAIANK